MNENKQHEKMKWEVNLREFVWDYENFGQNLGTVVLRPEAWGKIPKSDPEKRSLKISVPKGCLETEKVAVLES